MRSQVRALCHEAEAAVLPRCTAILAASELTAQLLTARFPIDARRIGTLPVPLQFEPAFARAAAAATSAAVAAVPPPAEPVRFITVANLIPRKNIVATLRIFGALRRAGVTAWALSIVGSEGVHPACARDIREAAAAEGITDAVCWRGELLGHDLEAAYLASHVFVVTSLFENYGMAAREAALFGLPLVGYDVGELAKFSRADARYLCPVGSEDSLRAEVGRWVTDRALLGSKMAAARSASAAERRLLEARPRISDTADRFEAAIHEAVRRHAAAGPPVVRA